jgi:hypothetical protein
MLSRRRCVYLACFTLHFALVGLICTHETLWLLNKHLTIAPASVSGLSKALDKVPAAILGDGLAAQNPIRRAIRTYANATGIEAGYGYFAPNIPETYALVFECHYPGGRVDYQTPSVHANEADLRLTSLIEQIGRTDYDAWRKELIERLARSTWQRHPDAISVRAFFGSITPPTVVEFCAGKKERTFRCLYVYDFSLGHQKNAPIAP